jgi:hypothetical protein
MVVAVAVIVLDFDFRVVVTMAMLLVVICNMFQSRWHEILEGMHVHLNVSE